MVETHSTTPTSLRQHPHHSISFFDNAQQMPTSLRVSALTLIHHRLPLLHALPAPKLTALL
ncbi:hypothetical protein HPP92_015618 [Vanilla planifolia]|uniref:Uncharacterized protein n=1 Tax=Vanilla planifolia TaxID=51239 RepID=A0A835QNQ3_VANPL|nr:hypothetical protein HPP92_016278 [Vanilla planifolia]KAG0471072.1 hypothetical protein HPP92_015618 [Vanilla planifolia]